MYLKLVTEHSRKYRPGQMSRRTLAQLAARIEAEIALREDAAESALPAGMPDVERLTAISRIKADTKNDVLREYLPEAEPDGTDEPGETDREIASIWASLAELETEA